MNWFRRREKNCRLRQPQRLGFETLEDRQLLSVNVLSYRYDQTGQGVNAQETTLTPTNVNNADFGKIATTPVDGQVYAEPLYVAGVNIAGGTHNVVYVATEHDSVYAIDANSGAVLWHDSFLSTGVTTVPWQDTGSGALKPEMGITATPVIDLSTNSIYVLANTKETRADGTHYVYKLHALDLGTGAENLGGPLTIADTICNNPTPTDDSDFTYVSGPSVNGTGAGSVNGVISFNALREFSRVGMTEVNGNIFMAFSSHPDVDPSHGWVLSVNASNMTLTGALNLTPNGTLGNIWQAGNSFVVDGNGNLYCATGNGTFDTTLNAAGFPVNGDYGDSIVKIAVDPTSTPTNQNINGWGLKVVDYFTPFNQQLLDDEDYDLNSGGLILLPPSAGSAANPNLMIQGGKYGTEYLLNQDNMGGFNPTTDQVVQEVPGFGNIQSIYSTPAYFNGTLYYATVGTTAKAYSLTNGQLNTTPTSQSPDTFGYPGATPVISANGTTNGIVWMIDNGTNQLRAYNANNLAQELYNSDQGPGGADALGKAVKFTVPTVADGHVFVGTQNSLVIYGLLSGGTTANANRMFVNAAYESILNRPAEAAAVTAWAQMLDVGLSRVVLTSALVHSDEYYSNVIDADFQRYLNRPVDSASLAALVSLMRARLSDETLESILVGSQEFYLRNGGTNKAWVDALYQDVLGRPADSFSEAYLVAALNIGINRQSIAYLFATSPEGEAVRIANNYQCLLNRTPAASETAVWQTLYRTGFSDENALAFIAASAEYFWLHCQQ